MTNPWSDDEGPRMDKELCFEASQLGWIAGQWPEEFITDNGTFYLVALCHRQGVVEYGCYVSPRTLQTATVFND
jgi:hypothetical protein